jgi:hypothetical protein
VCEAPDVFMCAVHQARVPKDAFILTPEPGMNWGRRILMFYTNSLIFVTKLDHRDWPIGIQRAVLNQTPDWICSGIFLWGDQEWRDMQAAIDSMMSPANGRPGAKAQPSRIMMGKKPRPKR